MFCLGVMLITPIPMLEVIGGTGIGILIVYQLLRSRQHVVASQ